MASCEDYCMCAACVRETQEILGRLKDAVYGPVETSAPDPTES